MLSKHLWLWAAVLCLMAPACSAAQQPAAPAGTSSAARQLPQSAPSSDYSKQSIVIERRRTTYRFENDGRGSRTEESSLRVQSEAGVQQLGQLRFGYNSGNQRIEIAYVRVRKPDGSLVTADASAVQDLTAPVARVAPLYTDYREKHVTVPGLRPGDTLEYKIIVETTTPLAPNQFWMEHTFREDLIVLDEQLGIDVPKSRRVILKTQPEFSKYDTREQGDRRTYTWNWKNLSTRAEREKAEVDAGLPRTPRKSADQPASVQLTTFQSWDELGKWYAGLERDRRAPSDDLALKARELTQGLGSDRDKVQAVYDYVAKNYRYASLSFGLGRYQPHAADEVFRNAYGDCKDKETLLAAMLDSLGFHANTVLIHSRQNLDVDVPSPLQFDHVIGDLKLGGQTIWMDTTTEVAPIGMLLLPLRNRKALQIRPGGTAEIVTTPSKIPYETFSRNELEGQISGLGKLTAHSRLTMRGDMEVLLRGVLRLVPEAKWNDLLSAAFVRQGLRDAKVTNITVPGLNDTSKPLLVEFDLAVANFLDWTAKEAKFFPPLERFDLPHPADDATEPTKLGGPLQGISVVKLRLPEQLTVTLPAPLAIKRDYAEYSAPYRVVDHVLIAQRELIIKLPELELGRSSDLQSFNRVLEADGRQQVGTENSGDASVAAAQDAPPKELEEAADHALHSGKFKQAAILYQKVTEKDPKHKYAWNNLGRAYMGMKEYNKASGAYHKALEVNAYDPWAWNNLGRVHEQQQRYDQAISDYRKQIEINPLDPYAHSNLGNLFLLLRRNSEGVPELERAAVISPDNIEIQEQLATAYLRTGQTEKAMETFDKVLQKSPTPGVWNNVAYSLADNNQHLDKAREYAESAVSTAETQLRNLSPEAAERNGLLLSVNLAAYWDTLGWVLFRQGEIDAAEKYINAAWKHSESGEVGYHLAQIYEKHGDKQKAIEMYAAAAASSTHIDPDALTALKHYVGPQKAEQMISAQRQACLTQRSINLSWTAKQGSAEVLLTFRGSGDVQSARFLNGSEEFKAYERDLRNLKLNLPLPDTTTEGVVHKAVVTCAPLSGCKLQWLPGLGSEADAEPGQAESGTD